MPYLRFARVLNFYQWYSMFCVWVSVLRSTMIDSEVLVSLRQCSYAAVSTPAVTDDRSARSYMANNYSEERVRIRLRTNFRNDLLFPVRIFQIASSACAHSTLNLLPLGHTIVI